MKTETKNKRVQTLKLATLMMPYVLEHTGAWEPVWNALHEPLKGNDSAIPPTLILVAKSIIAMAARKLEAVHLTPEDVQLATTGIDCNNLYRYRAIARYEDALEQEDEEMKTELFRTFGMHPDKNLYR